MGNKKGMTLKEYIETGNQSIASMAYTLGVSEHAVHKWVYGQRTPTRNLMVKIFDATGGQVTPNDFFGVGQERAA